MKKLIFVLIAALGVSCTSYAQMTEKELKKAVKAAQKTVKEARNDLENEAIMNRIGMRLGFRQLPYTRHITETRMRSHIPADLIQLPCTTILTSSYSM